MHKIASAAAALLCAGTASAHSHITGYLYTSLNSAPSLSGHATNQVVRLSRREDGRLSNEQTFDTGAPGGSNPDIGGVARGNFGAQGGVQIVEDVLLCVNAGGTGDPAQGTVSVFDLNRANGDLTLQGAPVNSGGGRPVSLSALKKSPSSDEYWVVVGNQWGSPIVILGDEEDTPAQYFPSKDVIEGIANGDFPDASAAPLMGMRNIYLFTLNVQTKTMTPEKSLDTYALANGGPTDVIFSPDGTMLAVTTFGLPHLFTVNPNNNGSFTQNGRVYVYDFDRATGDVSNERVFEEPGVAATIGFSWNRDPSVHVLYITSGNLVTMPESKRDHGVIVLEVTSSAVNKIQNFATGAEDGSTHMRVGKLPASSSEDCWTEISPDNGLLWVSSSAAAIVSTFTILPDGRLEIVGPGPLTEFISRPEGTAEADTKDMFISPDGRFLYLVGSFATFEMVLFDVRDTSPVLALTEEIPVAAATPVSTGNFNFLGLTGFDVEPMMMRSTMRTTESPQGTTQGRQGTTQGSEDGDQNVSGAVGQILSIWPLLAALLWQL